MNKIEIARLKYKPENIKYLLIAETPPKSDSDRFFYFEKVENHDSLFLETMKFLYPEFLQQTDLKNIRANKKIFLEKFRGDGFYLVDFLDAPFEEKYSRSQKIRYLKQGQDTLLKKIKPLINYETKIILISSTVYSAGYDFLKSNGIAVLNTEPVDFPGSGGQKKFREKIQKLFAFNKTISPAR